MGSSTFCFLRASASLLLQVLFSMPILLIIRESHIAPQDYFMRIFGLGLWKPRNRVEMKATFVAKAKARASSGFAEKGAVGSVFMQEVDIVAEEVASQVGDGTRCSCLNRL